MERHRPGQEEVAADAGARPLPARLVLASTNRGKLAEFAAILGARDVEVVAADAVVSDWGVEEHGTTFAENARIKAQDLASRSGLAALGDDSGLEVAALDGRPGVRSARYAGPGADATANVARLLDELRDVPDGARGGIFRCALALAWPDGTFVEAEGSFAGTIARAPRGAGGFGYDCVFLDPATGRTWAELAPAEKNARSHRRRALEELCAAFALKR